MKPKRVWNPSWILVGWMLWVLLAALTGCADDPVESQPSEPPRVYVSDGTPEDPKSLAVPIPYLLPFNFTDGEASREYSYYKAKSVLRIADGYVSFGLYHVGSLAFDVYLDGFPPNGSLFCTSRGGKTLFEQCSGHMTRWKEDFYMRVEYVGRENGAEYAIIVSYLDFSRLDGM